MTEQRKPHFISWLWNYTVVSNFMTGLFALLPIILTLAVIAFVGSYVHNFLGPESAAGALMKKFGAHFVTNEWVAYLIGGAAVFIGVWLFGAIIKSEAKDIVMRVIDTVMSMPIIKSIYDPAKQAVQMVKKDNPDMKGMEVVFVSFGGLQHTESILYGPMMKAMIHSGIKSSLATKALETLRANPEAMSLPGAGMIGLRVSPKTFVFKDCRYSMVYMPTSPVPMSGGIILVPEAYVEPIEVGPESMMQIYLTLGVVADKVLPEKYHQDHIPEEAGEEFLAELNDMVKG